MARQLTREDWLSLRRDSIGASEAAAACGESPYCSTLELWARKRGIMPEADLSAVEHIKWGNLLEPVIVRETCDRLGLRLLSVEEAAVLLGTDDSVEVVGIVEGRQLFLRSHEHPYMTATLDGVAMDANGQLVLIEAKTTGEFNREEWEDGKAPEHYRIQVAHQLAVAPMIACGVLSGLVGGNKLRITPFIERASAPTEAVAKIEREFWRRVQEDDPPAADGSESSADALKLMHPDDNGESIVLPESFIVKRAVREQLDARIKADTAARDAMDTELKGMLGPVTYGVLPDGSGTWSYKTQERAEYVCKATKYRVLRFSTPKAGKAGSVAHFSTPKTGK